MAVSESLVLGKMGMYVKFLLILDNVRASGACWIKVPQHHDINLFA